MCFLSFVILNASLWSPSFDINDPNAIGVLLEGYTRNRESFVSLECRFKWVTGKALSFDDAVAGRFSEISLVQNGHWLVNKSKVRYELLCDPDGAKRTSEIMQGKAKVPVTTGQEKTKSPTPFNVPCLDRLFLRNDAYSLKYGPQMSGANLFAKTDQDAEGIRVTPFNPDCLGADEYSSPSRYLRDALAGKWNAHFIGTQKVNGVDTLLVDVAQSMRFGFDPKKGYILAYASDTDPKTGKRRYVVQVTDI